ncbi:MAG: hypothetical protein JSW58_04970 [Candidatus Latescibacterota bacterium]|nr:MAG: hypothetical protein JSW58_04970 [Candidatus Latescibacterota bacterium]
MRLTIDRGTSRYVRSLLWILLLLLCCCDGSERCPCVPATIDPPIADLSVTWDGGYIWANLMPIVLPDPIGCSVSLILENKNTRRSFTKLEVPRANVVLAEHGSPLGTIPLETSWRGVLVAGEIDTVFFFKPNEDQAAFEPPCSQPVLLQLLIRNADGDSTFFEPDTLIFECTY